MEGKVGAPVKIAGFVRYALGEGIEKKADDFAGRGRRGSQGLTLHVLIGCPESPAEKRAFFFRP